MKTVGKALVLVALILGLSACARRERVPEVPNLSEVSYQAVEKTGEAPAEYSGAVLEKELLSKAAGVSDGYLLPENGTAKYGLTGELLWHMESPFPPEEGYARVWLVAAADDSFLLCHDSSTYQREDGSWSRSDPRLARYDREGTLLWTRVCEELGDTALGKIFLLEDGTILTVGDSEMPLTGRDGEIGPGDLYLSRIDRDGRLISEQWYGGSDFETFYDAAYLPGQGLVVLFSTQSGDGTFAASKSGHGEDVLMLVDDALRIEWFRPFGTLLAYDSMLVSEEGIFLLDLQNNMTEVGFDGAVRRSEKLRDKQCGVRLIGNSQYGLLTQQETELVFYRDHEIGLRVPFSAGTADRIIDTAEGFVIVSTNITGQLPTPLVLSSLWFSTELVYSGYDQKGNLLWRQAYDNTPPEKKNYNYEEDPYGLQRFRSLR